MDPNEVKKIKFYMLLRFDYAYKSYESKSSSFLPRVGFFLISFSQYNKKIETCPRCCNEKAAYNKRYISCNSPEVWKLLRAWIKQRNTFYLPKLRNCLCGDIFFCLVVFLLDLS